MTNFVTFNKEESVAVITIDNPPLNVINKEVQQQLRDVIIDIENDKEIVCVILTSAGDKAFMVGADIKEFPRMIENPGMKDEVIYTQSLLDAVDNLSKPTIAVLDGITYSGGFELALACDMRIAEEKAELGFPEIRIGFIPGGAGTQRLPRLIGEAKAKELMFTGEPITAAEAEEIGLVNYTAANGEGLKEAWQLANKITDKSLQALSRIKLAVNDGLEKPLSEGIKLEAELFEEIIQTDDVKEGVDAFFEKRKPHFTHL